MDLPLKEVSAKGRPRRAARPPKCDVCGGATATVFLYDLSGRSAGRRCPACLAGAPERQATS